MTTCAMSALPGTVRESNVLVRRTADCEFAVSEEEITESHFGNFIEEAHVPGMACSFLFLCQCAPCFLILSTAPPSSPQPFCPASVPAWLLNGCHAPEHEDLKQDGRMMGEGWRRGVMMSYGTSAARPPPALPPGAENSRRRGAAQTIGSHSRGWSWFPPPPPRPDLSYPKSKRLYLPTSESVPPTPHPFPLTAIPRSRHPNPRGSPPPTSCAPSSQILILLRGRHDPL